MKIKSIREVEPELSRCISVDSPDRLFSVKSQNDDTSILTHNSVVQRNIIISCILRPDSWRFLGIDLKRVELSQYRAYSNVVLGIATNLQDALTVLRFAQQTMMKRYSELEQLGLNNFLDLPEKGQALLVMVDEAGELLSPSGVKALSEETLIPTPYGIVKLKDLEIGDMIYDNYGKQTKITNKYEPVEQKRFSMKISNDSSGKSEDFIAGSEHVWVAYFSYPDGRVEGPEIVDTAFLHDFKKEQEVFTPDQRIQIKFKRYHSEDECDSLIPSI